MSGCCFFIFHLNFVCSFIHAFGFLLLKRTVSPDNGFYLRVYKTESVLLVGPLMVFTFFYLVQHEIFTQKNYILKLLL
jgi:hypothetical protein